MIRLDPLRRKDIPRCVELERTLFPGDSPWGQAAFRSELSSGALYLGAYTEDERLVGYAGLALVGPPGALEGEVHTIGVDPGFQRAGVGTALLRGLLARADQERAPVFLEVRTDNEPAIALYQRYGFARVGVRKRYYQPSGADAYTMRRPATTNEEVAG